jgi:hypothetical protein
VLLLLLLLLWLLLRSMHGIGERGVGRAAGDDVHRAHQLR